MRGLGIVKTNEVTDVIGIGVSMLLFIFGYYKRKNGDVLLRTLTQG